MNNYQYFGKLWVGSQLQEMTFIFDTGSAWTWIPNSDCPDAQCARNHYRYQVSSGYKNTGRIETVKYGIGSIKGNVVNDDISITNQRITMASDVNFISVFEANNLATLESDGLLGLSPKTERASKSGEEIHLLIQELKNDNIIDKAMFSMFLTDTSQQSRMHFGGYDQTIIDKFKEYNSGSSSDDGVYWMKINSDIHWQVRIYDYKVGNQTFGSSVKNLIFDTGSSLNYFPEREYNLFFAEIQKTKKCYFDPVEDLAFCDCKNIDDPEFPQIAIYIGSSSQKHWFYLLNKDYLQFS